MPAPGGCAGPALNGAAQLATAVSGTATDGTAVTGQLSQLHVIDDHGQLALQGVFNRTATPTGGTAQQVTNRLVTCSDESREGTLFPSLVLQSGKFRGLESAVGGFGAECAPPAHQPDVSPPLRPARQARSLRRDGIGAL